MTADAASSQRPARTAKSLRGDYRLIYGLALLTALLAFGGWIWAAVLAFGSVSSPGLGRPDLACGSPVFFDSTAVAQQNGEDWAAACADTVDMRVRQAVGISLVATPIGVLWIFCASQLPRLRTVADAAAENEEPEGEPSS